MWMTSRQALQLSAAVRKGETGATVVFASRFTKSEDDGKGGEINREIPYQGFPAEGRFFNAQVSCISAAFVALR